MSGWVSDRVRVRATRTALVYCEFPSYLVSGLVPQRPKSPQPTREHVGGVNPDVLDSEVVLRVKLDHATSVAPLAVMIGRRPLYE